MRRSFLLLVAVTLLTATRSLASPHPPRDSPRERKIEQALELISPGAVPTFRRATQAMDSDKNAEAEPLYREVLASAPQFTPAMRRLGYALNALGRHADALAFLNRAVQLDRSPENLISLVDVLAFRRPGTRHQLRSRRRRSASQKRRLG